MKREFEGDKIVCPYCGKSGTIIERKDIVEYDKVVYVEHDYEYDAMRYTVERKNRYKDDNSVDSTLECEYCGAEWKTIGDYVEDIERYEDKQQAEEGENENNS